jgi:hypothetical protein
MASHATVVAAIGRTHGRALLVRLDNGGRPFVAIFVRYWINPAKPLPAAPVGALPIDLTLGGMALLFSLRDCLLSVGPASTRDLNDDRRFALFRTGTCATSLGVEQETRRTPESN